MKFTYNHTMKCCFLAYMCSAIVNNILPLLFITLQKNFDITVAQLGFLVALNFGEQMFVDFLGARYADKFGYRTVIVTALILCAVGLVFLGTLPFVITPLAGLVISVCTYAAGSGLLEVVVSPVTEALPTENKEASMSLMHSFYCWGHLVCVVISTAYFVLLGVQKWRYLIYVWAILPLVTAILFTKMPMCSLLGSSHQKINLSSVFSQKTFFAFVIIMICSGAAEQSMAQWISYFAEDGLKVSKTLGDLLGTSMFALCMGIGRVFYSKCAHRINLVKYLIFCSATLVLMYLGAALIPNPVVALLCCGVFGFAVSVMWPGTLSLASSTLAGRSTAMFALLAVGGDIGCTIGPEVVAFGASLFSVNGSVIKAGIICSVVFPVVLIICIKKVLKKRKI